MVVPLCVLLIVTQMRTVGGWHNAIATGEWRHTVVSSVAGVVGMVPEGLVLLTSLNFALAAIRLARKNTLVQDLDSVETLARVDALNLDKTGTITDGGIVYDDFIALPGCRNKQHAMQALYDLANEESPNGTGRAVLRGSASKASPVPPAWRACRSQVRANGARSRSTTFPTKTRMACGTWVPPRCC